MVESQAPATVPGEEGEKDVLMRLYHSSPLVALGSDSLDTESIEDFSTCWTARLCREHVSILL